MGPRLNPSPYFRYPSMYDEYCERVEERACELIDTGKWDAWEMTLYERGEMSRDEVYEVAIDEACKQIYREFTNA